MTLRSCAAGWGAPLAMGGRRRPAAVPSSQTWTLAALLPQGSMDLPSAFRCPPLASMRGGCPHPSWLSRSASSGSLVLPPSAIMP